jgi:hypothetical protein
MIEFINTLRNNDHDGFTLLRATSRSSPLPAEPDFDTSSLKSSDHVVHCSTTLNAEENTQASTKSGGSVVYSWSIHEFNQGLITNLSLSETIPKNSKKKGDSASKLSHASHFGKQLTLTREKVYSKVKYGDAISQD